MKPKFPQLKLSPSQIMNSPLFWLIIIVIATTLVGWLFFYGYQRGVSIGQRTPKKEKPASQTAQVDMAKLRISTPEMIAKGKQLFLVNCASCHGPEGKGDGERAAELNPKPRNYHTEKFKFGAAPLQIYNAVTNGSPGTSMPAFVLLPAEDRWALVHYVRTQIPNPPDDSPEEIAKLGGGEVATTATATTTTTITATTTATGPRIPIVLAMQKIAEPEIQTKVIKSIVPTEKGKSLYQKYCTSCHGPSGEGKYSTQITTTYTSPYVTTKSLNNPKALWVRDKKVFTKIVVEGLPGRLKPGLGTLTKAQLDELYNYVKMLAEAQ